MKRKGIGWCKNVTLTAKTLWVEALDLGKNRAGLMQLTHHPEQIAPHCTNLDCFASLSDRPSRARPYTLLEGESKTDQSHAMSDHMLVELFLGAELC